MTIAEQRYKFSKRYKIIAKNYVDTSTKVYVANDRIEGGKNIVLVVTNFENEFNYRTFDGFKSEKVAKENAFKLSLMLSSDWAHWAHK